MNIEGKYIFGLGSIITLGLIQITAWLIGSNGQINTMITGAIIGIITFLLGLNLPSPAEKKAINDAITSIINQKKP